MVEITLRSKRYHCDLTLYEKITVIKGDSAAGKTEFTRKLTTDPNAQVNVSNGFDLTVLTEERFQDICRIALKKCKKESKEEKEKFLRQYWEHEDNFPFDDTIIIVDDEVFTRSIYFSILVNTDQSNYYIIIDRKKLPNLSYSVNEVYKFIADGKNHYIERVFQFPVFKPEADVVMVEGEGSDSIFFRALFKNNLKNIEVVNPSALSSHLKNSGRSAVVKVLEEYGDEYKNKTVFMLVDCCAFGSDMEDLIWICAKKGIQASFYKDYLSFEYLLLKSNFINDQQLGLCIERDRLKFHSLEALFEQRLKEITAGMIYKYNKSAKEFPVCYYKDCCSNKSNYHVCELRTRYINKNKFIEMLRDTEFSFLLEMAHSPAASG